MFNPNLFSNLNQIKEKFLTTYISRDDESKNEFLF